MNCSNALQVPTTAPSFANRLADLFHFSHQQSRIATGFLELPFRRKLIFRSLSLDIRQRIAPLLIQRPNSSQSISVPRVAIRSFVRAKSSRKSFTSNMSLP
jgi:hypothetical protein